MDDDANPLRSQDGGVAWRYHPRSRGAGERDENQRFRSAVEAALRAGHGARVSIGLRFGSGARPAVLLTALGGASVRWVERALLGAYDPEEWRHTTVPPTSVALDRWSFRRRALPGERAAGPIDPGVVGRTILHGLATVRTGAFVEVRLRPLAESTFVRWTRTLTPSPPRPLAPIPVRPRDGSRVSVPAAPPSDPGPSWTADVELAVPKGFPPEQSATVLRSTEGAWRRLDGSGASVTRGPRWFPGVRSFVLAETEIATLLPYRWEGGSAPDRPAGRRSLALGRTRSGEIVGLTVEPREGRHLAVLGETGMGKSSLLVTIAARVAEEAGLLLLDPLGETADSVSQALAERSVEALVIAPGERSPRLNALAGIGPSEEPDLVRSERRLEDLVHALRRVRAARYSESPYWGPRLEEVLGRALRAAAAIPGGTIEDAHTMLATAGQVRQVVPPEARLLVRELADRVRTRPEDAEGARRLLYEVVRNPTLATMICAREPTLAVSELVHPGRVVIISGRAALVGETTARYLLSVYLALVWSELIARPTSSKTFVLLDEAQWFAHESLAEMLRLARRRNVHVAVATQTLTSLPEGVREALWTNVADWVAFRGAPDEAREFARIARGVSPESILSLPRGEAAVMLGKGSSVSWVRTVHRPSDPRGSRLSDTGGPVRPDPGASTPGLPPTSQALGPGASAGAAGGARTDVTVDEWMLELARRAGALAPGTLLALPLAELADDSADGRRSIRRIGSVLGRAGAIVRAERGAAGTTWWIDPSRMPRGRGVRSSAGGDSPSPSPTGL